MRSFTLFFFILLIFFCRVPVGADELEELFTGFETEEQPSTDTEIDDLLGGFDQSDEVVSEKQQKEPVLPEWLELQGSLNLQSTVNFGHNRPEPDTPDYRGLSMFRTIAEVIYGVSFSGWQARLGATAFYDMAYHFNGQRDSYTSEYLEQYEKEFEIQEAYFQGSLSGNLDLKVGRQIVVWGRSDNIRVSDILNPLDRRWPGMVDIRFLRLPVTMSRLDYYVAEWNLSTILIHEPRFDKLPVYNGEFYPFPMVAPPVDEPDARIDNQQLGLAVNGIFSGWDISFYAASVFDKSRYTETDPAGMTVRKHQRVFMSGLAANLALGNWLLKTEAAYWDGLKFSTVSEEKSRLDVLAGLEYTGFADTNISFELADRHLFDFDPRMKQLPDGQQEDWQQFALRYTGDFMNDTVHLTVLVSSYGFLGADGGFERLQLEYDFSDSLSLTCGLVFYESGDFPAFREIGDSDRFLLELEYRF